MPYGYNGKILHVNLTTGEFIVETPAPAFYRKYLGGSALNTYYLLKEIPVGADPLGPENVVAISVGVTTGARVAGQSRVTMGAKSPLTGRVGDSQAGGYFPAEMKYAGFDAFIITGKAKKPVYLSVIDGEYELRDASHLRGKLTGEVEDLIREELGDPKVEIAQIGPAGENGVLFANVMNMCNRANGRTGIGAVMGSKNLRAVAVRGKAGKKAYTVAHPEEFKELAQKGVKRLKGSFQEIFGKFGTPISMMPQTNTGQLPTRNFTSGVFEGTEKISGETMYNEYLRGAKDGKQDGLGRDTCFACPIRCKRVFEMTEGDILVDPRYGGPEYETLSQLGSLCGIDNLVAVAKANELCSKYGMDTISVGATIAWAMECFENGVITQEDTGGLELKFGYVPAYLQILEMIAKREGFGDILAQGSVKASQIIGRGSDKYLAAANGQEMAAHMGRVKVGLGINYAMNSYGADHMSCAHDPQYELQPGANPDEVQVSPTFQELGLTSPTEPRSLGAEKMRFIRTTQDYNSALDSLCWCMIASGSMGGLFIPSELVEIINLVTGWDMTLEELIRVGERKYNMQRLFNAREGFGRHSDILPEKMYEPLVGGVTEGFSLNREKVNEALLEMYRQRGWNEDSGNPSHEKIAELGLEWIAV